MSAVQFKAQLGVVSRYKLEVRKKTNDELVNVTPWCENLIPQRGIDVCLRGGTHGNPRLRCLVGTGNAAPQMTDTALQAQFASSESVQSVAVAYQTSEAPYWLKQTSRFRFDAGVFNNTNIAEVGTCEYYGSAWLYSRALVVDANGNPAAVTILSDEYLDVVWEQYVIVGEYAGTFNQLIDGVATEFTYSIRPIGMLGANWSSASTSTPNAPIITPSVGETIFYSGGYANAALSGPATSDMGGTQNGRFLNTSGSPAYVDGTSVRRIRFNMGLNQGNAGAGITGFKINLSGVQFQCLISPAVLKVNTKVYYFECDITLANAAIPE